MIFIFDLIALPFSVKNFDNDLSYRHCADVVIVAVSTTSSRLILVGPTTTTVDFCQIGLFFEVNPN